MLWQDIKDPDVRMVRARRRLLANRIAHASGGGYVQGAFWGVLASHLQFIRRDEPGMRMATDGVSLFYSADFVMSLTEEECAGVIAHEAQHCGLRHFARMDGRDMKGWNIATDHAINLDLTAAGFTLPSDRVEDAQFAGMAAEQIYPVVMRKRDEDKRKGGSGSGDGKPGDGQCPWGQVVPGPIGDDGKPMSQTEIDTLASDWAKRTKQALGAARKAGKMAGGAVPSELVQVTKTMGDHAMRDWRSELRRFIDDLGSKDTDWATLDRRAMAYGMAYPGERVVRPSVIAWHVDVSGSMDARANRAALVEAQAALDDNACDFVEVVYVDTSVKRVERFAAGDTIILRDGTGGGTDFHSAMVRAGEQDDYAAIVFVTDGQTYRWGPEPQCPVLWAITATQAATDRLKPPFGDTLCLYQ